MTSRLRFVVNLRDDTTTREFRAGCRPAGYLLAPNNATPGLRAAARDVRARGLRLLADNGNFVTIGQVAERFAARAAELRSVIENLERRLHRSVRDADVPPEWRRRYRELATEVALAGREALAPDATRLEQQLQLAPTDLIGAEDLTAALWLRLSLEPAYTGIGARELAERNRQVARLATRELARLDAPLDARYFPVASAMSYGTAFDAGRIFARAGLARAAMGFGAFMADDNYTDTLRIGRRNVAVGGRVPQRLLRTIAVARGFWDGYRREAGRAPDAFHFLGLGAPISMALVTLAAQGTPELSFDAMSPILDAVQGTLYVDRPALLKVRTRRVAWRLAIEVDRRWTCPCPFCRRFVGRHPFDYRAAARWGRAATALGVGKAHLQPGGALYDCFPLLAEPATGMALRQEVSETRGNHNHWILGRLLARLTRAHTRGTLSEFVGTLVDDYDLHSDSESAKRAARFGLRLARGEFAR